MSKTGTYITWRIYLDRYVQALDAQEKQRLLEKVGITRTTLQRWRNGSHLPKAEHIVRLLAVLPHQVAEALFTLLNNDLRTQSLLPLEPPVVKTTGISEAFYAEIFRLQRNISERFWLLCSAILQNALEQLENDPGQPVGIEIVIAHCMPPRDDGKIRSLQELVGMGTPPFRQDLHSKEFFLGSDSLAGWSITRRHGEMVPDLQLSTPLPTLRTDLEQSSAAFPILFGNSIAGAFIISCTKTYYFTAKHLELLEQYSDLVRLAFYDRDFYPASSIDLRPMPSWEKQRTTLERFQQRVEIEYRRSVREESFRDTREVEQRVRSQIEDEFLRMASGNPLFIGP